MTKCNCPSCAAHWGDEDKRGQYDIKAALNALDSLEPVDDDEMESRNKPPWLDCNQEIRKAAFRMGEFLVKKNVSYGNAIFEPLQCFGKGSAMDNVNGRIDEKMKRLISKNGYHGDDDAKDLCGYLILRMAILAMEIDK